MFQLRNRYFALLDILVLSVTPILALGLRTNLPWEHKYNQALLIFTVLTLLIKLPTFYFFRLYARYWRYASIDELLAIFLAVGTTTVIVTGIYWIIQDSDLIETTGFPRSVPIIDGLLTLLAVGGFRMSIRVIEYLRQHDLKRGKGKRVLIVGAGDAGAMILHEVNNSHRVSIDPIGLLDDDPHKQGAEILGVRVLGPVAKLLEMVADYHIEMVIIAMPTAPGATIREVVRLCEQAGVPSKTVPGIYELLSGQASISRIRNIEIEDLLRREPVKGDMARVQQIITGKRVIVTGAGGSIGTELCLQLARCNPAQLIALGHGENSLFSLSYKVSKVKGEKYGDGPFDLRVVVADIRDKPRLERIFSHYQPQIIFHAAAHKHVAMMEDNVEDAVTNNVLGTRNLVELSMDHNVERFVLISTDKAVHPINVMGATKRIAELIVQEAGFKTGRSYVSVRFGNVLGSRGSVVPFFSQQIVDGGPVTVTHPEVERYFMTIPEAVHLVLQAAVLGKGGNIMVLEMGEPVKIVNLARDLIELSGCRVDDDIKITFTGLRPGEKLKEVLYGDGEILEPTEQEKILQIKDNIPGPAGLNEDVSELILLAQRGDVESIRKMLVSISSGLTKNGATSE